jgi:8-oxo-dGTP diphosphatase
LERFTLRAAAYLLLIADGEILMTRRFRTGWRDGQYSLIAGHLDSGETMRTAVCREAREEAGIIIDPGDLHFVHVMQHYEKKQYFDFYFKPDRWEGTPSNCEPERCDDMRWFPLQHLPDNTVPNVRQALESYMRDEFYSEFGVELRTSDLKVFVLDIVLPVGEDEARGSRRIWFRWWPRGNYCREGDAYKPLCVSSGSRAFRLTAPISAAMRASAEPGADHTV